MRPSLASGLRNQDARSRNAPEVQPTLGGALEQEPIGMATETVGPSVPIIRVHPGELDVSLRARIEQLERRMTELEQTVDKLCRTSAREHDAISDRVRELELAR